MNKSKVICIASLLTVILIFSNSSIPNTLSDIVNGKMNLGMANMFSYQKAFGLNTGSVKLDKSVYPVPFGSVGTTAGLANFNPSPMTSRDGVFPLHRDIVDASGSGGLISKNVLPVGNVIVHIRVNDRDYDTSAAGIDHIQVGVNDANHGPVAVQITRQGNSMLLATAGGPAAKLGRIVNLNGTALPPMGNSIWSQVRDLGPMTEIAPDAGIFQADLPIELTDGPQGTDCPTVDLWDATINGLPGFSIDPTTRFNISPAAGMHYCVRQGDVLTVTYIDTSDASNHTQKVTDSATFDLRSGVLQSDKSVYNIGSDVILTLVEPDFNLDSQTAETAPLDLIEWDSHAFKNTIGTLGGQSAAFEAMPSTFVETGKDTGIFQSMIKIPTQLNGNLLEHGEEIRLEYTDWGPAGAKTVGANNQNVDQTIFTSNTGATVELDQKVYTWTDRVFITVTAPDRNFDPNLIDTINATIFTNSKTLNNYKLSETGVDTGIFTGYVILTGDPNILQHGVDGNGLQPTGAGPIGTGPTDGFMPSKNQDNITAVFNLGSGTIKDSSLIRWNVGEIKWSETNYPINGKGVLQIVDPDMNLNPKAVDTFGINVWSDSDLGGIKLTMTETGEATGVFLGTVNFDANLSSSGNRLHISQGDTVTAGYTDVTLPPPSVPGSQLKLTATTLIGNTELSTIPTTFQKLHITFSKNPPKFTPVELAQINANIEQMDLPDNAIPITNNSISQAIPGAETNPGSSTNIGFSGRGMTPPIVLISQESHYQPISFGSFSTPLNSTVPIDGDTRGVLLEPSAAHGYHSSTIFYTTNLFDAVSDDDGTTWEFVDPVNNTTDFLNNYCCDQDVIYDPNNQIFIWLQLGEQTSNINEEKFRLAVSTDARNWQFTDVTPGIFNKWQTKSVWWDYPQIAITNNNLIITTDVRYFGNPQVDNAILRASLSDLKNNSPLTWEVNVTSDDRTITPVQGATNTIYLASQTNSNDKLRIFTWPDNSHVAQVNTLSIDAWTPLAGGAKIQCTPGSMDNWCAHANNKILNGWIVNNHLGFFWNAPNDTHGFTKPYVNAAMFDISGGSISYVGRPYIFSSSTPWMYAYGYPNSQGLGWMAIVGNHFPVVQVGAADNASITSFTSMSSSFWNSKTIASSNFAGTEFGDYLRVRSYDETNCKWLGSGYTLQAAADLTSPPLSQPIITVFKPTTCVIAMPNAVTKPSPPLGLSHSETASKVDLSWNEPNSNGHSPISRYEIDRSKDGGHTWDHFSTSDNSTRILHDTSVTSGIDYIYQVRAINAIGSSNPSDTVSVHTPSCSCPSACAFGDELPDHREPTSQLQSIKDFRDDSIVSTTVGADFMKVFNPVYFSLGSPIASYESQNPWFQQTVKFSIYPLLYILEVSEKPYDYIHGEFGILSYGIVTSLLIGGVYLSPFALLVKQVRKNKFNYKIAIIVISAILIAILAAELNGNHYALMTTTSLFVILLLSISAILVAKLINKIGKILH